MEPLFFLVDFIRFRTIKTPGIVRGAGVQRARRGDPRRAMTDGRPRKG
uniref:Uncharacterized protein n=1 Tax=Arundo donax TaxID=35708 RepID=A0A0A9H2W3_ARUDO